MKWFCPRGLVRTAGVWIFSGSTSTAESSGSIQQATTALFELSAAAAGAGVIGPEFTARAQVGLRLGGRPWSGFARTAGIEGLAQRLHPGGESLARGHPTAVIEEGQEGGTEVGDFFPVGNLKTTSPLHESGFYIRLSQGVRFGIQLPAGGGEEGLADGGCLGPEPGKVPDHLI